MHIIIYAGPSQALIKEEDRVERMNNTHSQQKEHPPYNGSLAGVPGSRGYFPGVGRFFRHMTAVR